MPTKGQKALADKTAKKAAMRAQPPAEKPVDEPVNLTEVSGSKKNKAKVAKKATTSSKRGSTARY